MILHPDGRIEGTPLEIIAYKKLISPAPTDEEESDPERPTPEQLNERLVEAAHAAKTPIPSGLGGIYSQPKGPDTFYIKPGGVTPLSSCPVCKSNVRFQKGFITEQEY